jgi:tetratricopeptide (TPR) repeat protein
MSLSFEMEILKQDNLESISGLKTPEERQVGLVCILLALLVLAIFGQTVKFSFVNYDDPSNVYENATVQKGVSIEAVGWAFTHTQVANWIPLTTLSHMLDCQIFGLHAGGHHLVNVLLHASNAVLLFLVLRQMTGRLWRSAFVAAVFAIHPLRAESVAWVSERKDVLSGFFFLMTLGIYVGQVRQPSRIKYVAMLLCFALGLMAKSMVATLPLVLLLLDYWPLGRWHSRRDLAALVKEKIPLFVLAAAGCMAAALVPGLVVPETQRFPLLDRIGNALVSYMFYLRQTILPVGLATAYPMPPNYPPKWEIYLAFVLLGAITAGVLAQSKKRPFLLTGWLWYFGMLVPVIGIVQISPYAAYADRYTYLPGIGLAIAATWALADWSAKWEHRRMIVSAAMIVAIGALSVCGHHQTSFWRNDETLWTRALDCTSSNSLAHFDLGVALFEKGEKEKAIAQYRKALEIQPNYGDASANLGAALLDKGETNEAIALLRKALQSNSNDVRIWNGLGVTLFANGQKEEAATVYRKALEIKPDYAEARCNLGIALFDKGEKEDAIAQYRKALEIDPTYAKAEYNWADALAIEGRVDEAMAHYRKALQIKPDYAYAYYGLGANLSLKQQWPEAIVQFRQALALKPDFAQARQGLGKALLHSGDFDGALACFPQIAPNPDVSIRWLKLGGDLLQEGDLEEAILCDRQAIKINPRLAEAHADLGLACFERGQVKEAIDFWQQSLKIKPDQPTVQNNLAWVLATTPDPLLRNGTAAIVLAEQADHLNNNGNPFVLHTLAAAYAEGGLYTEATATAQRALQLAQAQKIDDLTTKLPKEIKLYEADQPLRIGP